MKPPAPPKRDARELAPAEATLRPAPKLAYRPRKPKHYRPRIGLIGCGGISLFHLRAYRLMGYDVAALCSRRESAARERQREFYPKAEIYTDYRALLDRADIDVIDLATPPGVRAVQIEDALNAGKHVLSQKPYCSDLATGRRLAALAKRRNVCLAVNQNGRWAPYFSYLREFTKSGRLGKIHSVTASLAWNHTWIQGTPFENLHHVLFFDFAIHWLDIISCLYANEQALGVQAGVGAAGTQRVDPPLNGRAIITYPSGQAALTLCGNTPHGNVEQLLVSGSEGLFQASGPICAAHDVRIFTAQGECRPRLEGHWFPDGMAGAMGELLCAIEEGREPDNSASNNLISLGLCFAVLESTRSGKSAIPGRILQAGPGCVPETTRQPAGPKRRA